MKSQALKIPCVGYEIAADWYEGSNDEVLLVLIGYSSNKARYRGLVSAVVEKAGMSALVIDYTGHGESPFELDDLRPAQNFLEVVTAFDWLAEHHPDKAISVMGSSYGGFHATQLTKYRKFQKLVLRVPALYPPDMFYTKWRDVDIDALPNYRSNADNAVDHPLLKRVSDFSGEVFVVTHEFDDSCPKPSTDAFAKAFRADTWEAKGFKHGVGESNPTSEQLEEYQNKIAEWLKEG